MAPNVIGFDTFVGNVASAARAVTDRAYARAGGYAILGNAHVLVTAKHDTLVREAVNGAWQVFPDGAPVAWMQRRAGVRDAERIAGADLMLAVVRRGTEYGLRHALFGSTSHVLERLEARLRFEEPQAVICAAVAPPFASLDALAESVDEVTNARPDVVWVALGAPKQELFMARYADRFDGAMVLGVGAAFDFLSGMKKRAPEWMQRAGLEWAHRFAAEPRRLARRYFTTNSEFLLRALLASGRRP